VAVDAGCTFYRAGNPQKNRILPHAAQCRFLSDELKAYAGDTVASMLLGAKLEQASMASPSTSSQHSQSTGAPESDTGKSKTRKLPVPSKLELDFTAMGNKTMQEKVNHSIMKLICVNGLVPNILDSDNWAELMTVLNHRYKVTHADDFTRTIIPNEAAHVRKLALARLRKEQNLTLTFDGNSTRQSDSVYFVHVTTKDRESYFLNGYEGSEERHTAEWVKDKIIKVLLLSFQSALVT
jgi:hypothetical protein